MALITTVFHLKHSPYLCWLKRRYRAVVRNNNMNKVGWQSQDVCAYVCVITGSTTTHPAGKKGFESQCKIQWYYNTINQYWYTTNYIAVKSYVLSTTIHAASPQIANYFWTSNKKVSFPVHCTTIKMILESSMHWILYI